MRHAYTNRRPGMAMVYGMLVLTVLLAMASLAVDLGRVQLAKTELRQAADAAARYAVSGISDGTATSKAISAASENNADGTSVTVTAADVQVGHWYEMAKPQFNTTLTPRNAVQVTVSRTAARKNAVPLMFASLIGMPTCDVNVTAVAKIGPKVPYGWIGLEAFEVKNNLMSKSYDSAVDPSPNSSGIANAGMLGTNVSITAKNNEVAGLVVLGPGATSNLSLPSSPMQLPDPIPGPVPDFSGAPASNPGGVSQNLSVPGDLTLPGGTYYFTSITMGNNSSLRFSGPATVYVSGNVNFSQSGEIVAYNSVPANLQIKQRGAGTIFGGDNANNVTVTASIDAPQTDLIANNCPGLHGRGTFKTITVKNNAEFYYDEALQIGIPGYGQAVTLVR